MAATETRACPHCGGEIMAVAVLCKYCREKVKPVIRASISSEVCPHCDSHLKPNAKFCGKCGESVIVSAPSKPQAPPPRTAQAAPPQPIRQQVPESKRATYNKKPDSLIFPTKKKSTVAAVILSIFWPGSAQIYLGQVAVGIVMMIISAIMAFVTFGSFHVIFAIGAVYNAWRDSRRLNKGLPIHKWLDRVKEVRA